MWVGSSVSYMIDLIDTDLIVEGFLLDYVITRFLEFDLAEPKLETDF